MGYVSIACVRCNFHADCDPRKITPIKCPLCGGQLNRHFMPGDVDNDCDSCDDASIVDAIADVYVESRMSYGSSDDDSHSSSDYSSSDYSSCDCDSGGSYCD